MGSLARESPLPLKLPQFWPDIEKLRKIAEPLSSFRSGRTIEDLFYDLNHLIFRWKLSETRQSSTDETTASTNLGQIETKSSLLLGALNASTTHRSYEHGLSDAVLALLSVGKEYKYLFEASQRATSEEEKLDLFRRWQTNAPTTGRYELEQRINHLVEELHWLKEQVNFARQEGLPTLALDVARKRDGHRPRTQFIFLLRQLFEIQFEQQPGIRKQSNLGPCVQFIVAVLKELGDEKVSESAVSKALRRNTRLDKQA